MRRGGQLVSALVPVALIAVAAWFVLHGGTDYSRVPLPAEPAPKVTHGHGWYNGVALAQLRDLHGFEKVTGEHPQIVQLYLGFTKPLELGAARTLIRGGAMPLFEINPRGITLTAIAGGGYDRILRTDAAAIRALGRTVAIAFAHEANGDWFSWGCKSQSAAAYIAAWRHIHKVLGTRDVRYVWVVNHTWNGVPSRCRVLARYPGAAYVDWIGVDGYLRNPGDTYASVFGHTVSELKPLRKPVLLTEAGVPAGHGQAARIASIYAGARWDGLAGIVYFDSATRKGDYRPQDNPAALSAFRKALSG